MATTQAPGTTPAPTAPLADTEGPDDLDALVRRVPAHPWFRVRVVAMATAATVFAWWTRVEGLVTDRISASVAIGLFLVCAFVGAPWGRWLQVAVGAVLYAAMWFVYESTRGAADQIGLPHQMAAVRAIDGVLFAGAQPTEVLQREWYTPGVVGLHDQVLSLVYYSHFVVPVVAVAAVWATGHTMWVRFMRRFATVTLVACVVFVVLPTVPPWMASDPRFGWGVGEPLVRHVRRGIVELGFGGFAHDWGIALDWSNAVAAMPSLHAAFSLFVVVFAAPLVRRRWARFALFAYPLAMGVSLVYFAEHWVIDVLAGWGLTAASFLLWARLERGARARRIDAARTACADLRVPEVAATGPVRSPEPVLLDRSFIAALTVPAHPHHGDALRRYGDLLGRHAADEVRLVARRDHLDADGAGRRDRDATAVLAPVHPLAVPRQHRRQAARLDPADLGPATLDADDVLTLVVARREGARRVLRSPVDARAVSARTAPPTATRSTA
jgi:hypothetical protein